MRLERQLTFWIAALAVLVLLLWLLGGVLLPFGIGLVVAYFLHPVADRLERLGLPRWAAATLILGVFLLSIALALVLMVPVLAGQLQGLAERTPDYAAALQRIFTDITQGWLQRQTWIAHLFGGTLPDVQRLFGTYLGAGAEVVLGFLTGLWSGGRAVLGLVGVLVITPVVAFYLLLDWDRMVAAVDSWVPRPHAPTVRAIAREIDAAVAGFVRGQAVVCLILGLYYATGLSAVGLAFGLLIGLATGLGAFIPYVGAILGFLAAISVAIVQFWPDWRWMAGVAVVFAIGQVLEGYVLTPRLVGGRIGVHPVWLIFSLLAAGSLFGFTGLLVAVPVAAAIGVLIRFALAGYLASPVYTGQPEPGPVRVAEPIRRVGRLTGEPE